MKTVLIVFLFISSFCGAQIDSLFYSHHSGKYSKSFYLKLSNKSGNKIYYSQDGNYPSTLFSDSLLITKTTSIRVKNEGDLTGYSQNYLFNKHLLPVVFITMKPSDLFDSVVGIYAMGKNAEKEPPYFGANFHKNWEKEGYIELLNTEYKSEFNQKVGYKIFGQFSAMLPQKSFSIHARKKYGEKRINAEVFEELEFKKYKSLVLRNSGSDFCNSHFRDVLMTSLVSSFNIETQASRSCIVYLNGEYWGIYHLREKINEHFLKQHFGVDKDSVAIMKNRDDVQQYGRLNYKKMLSFISNTDFSIQRNLDSLSQLMDIDNYLDYNIAQVYFNNLDAGGNIRYWRHIGNTGKWRWILFDTDFGFGMSDKKGFESNTVEDYLVRSSRNWPYPNWSTLIIRSLLENDSIKEVYIKKFTKYLNNELSARTVNKRILEIENELRPEIGMHFKKWNRSEGIWKTNLQTLKEFGEKRPFYLRNHLVHYFDLDTTYKLKIESFDHGNIVIDGRQYSDSVSGVFFGKTAYSFNAIPHFGFHFGGWNKELIQKEMALTFVSNMELQPVFFQNSKSPFQSKIRINELCKKDSVHENYIELANLTDTAIDLSGWLIMNHKGKQYTLPNNTIISPHGFIVVFTKEESESGLKGLFNIKSTGDIYLYSDKEELVDHVELTKDLFGKHDIGEYVGSTIRKGWIAKKVGTPGKMNSAQKKAERENKYILIGFLVAIVLLFLFVLIHVIRVKK